MHSRGRLNSCARMAFSERVSLARSRATLRSARPQMAQAPPLLPAALEAVLREKVAARGRNGPVELRTAVRVADADGVGSLTLAQFEGALRQFHLGGTPQDVAALFRSLDAGGGGSGRVPCGMILARILPSDFPDPKEQLKARAPPIPGDSSLTCPCPTSCPPTQRDVWFTHFHAAALHRSPTGARREPHCSGLGVPQRRPLRRGGPPGQRADPLGGGGGGDRRAEAQGGWNHGRGACSDGGAFWRGVPKREKASKEKRSADCMTWTSHTPDVAHSWRWSLCVSSVATDLFSVAPLRRSRAWRRTAAAWTSTCSSARRRASPRGAPTAPSTTTRRGGAACLLCRSRSLFTSVDLSESGAKGSAAHAADWSAPPESAGIARVKCAHSPSLSFLSGQRGPARPAAAELLRRPRQPPRERAGRTAVPRRQGASTRRSAHNPFPCGRTPCGVLRHLVALLPLTAVSETQLRQIAPITAAVPRSAGPERSEGGD